MCNLTRPRFLFRFPQVADLGLSKVKQQTFVSGGVRGTLPWMAPELLNGNSNLVSEKVAMSRIILNECNRIKPPLIVLCIIF